MSRIRLDLKNISIHALREEGDILTLLQRFRPFISIHALREEGDKKAVLLHR